MLPSKQIQVNKFYTANNCRLHVCPGQSKHPTEVGYANSDLRTWDVTSRLVADSKIQRYCWMHDDDHLIIDVDLHDPAKNGMESLERLSKDLGIDLAEVCRATVTTPTGGLHLCFRKPAEMKIRTLGSVDRDRYAGLDTLGRSVRNNSLTIAVGSTHPVAEGRYEWVQDEPELIDAPAELLRLLEVIEEVREVIPRDEDDDSPGSQFMRSSDGVDLVGRLMGEKGYTFREADGYFEFQRPGKSTASQFSGFLGKLTDAGNYTLTSFSHSDEIFQPNQCITILEALRLLRGDDDFRSTVRWLAAEGWGRPSVEKMFGDIDPEAGVDVVVGDSSIGELTDEFWNFRNVDLPPDSKGQVKTVKVGLTMPELVAPWLRLGWPRICQKSLFVHENGKVRVIDRAPQLFAWIQMKQKTDWQSGGDKISKDEFLQGLAESVAEVDAIAGIPHCPPIEGIYYTQDMPVGNEADLDEFVDHFAAATDVDRLLIKAAIVTPFWGGGGGLGNRPIFVISSEDGIGSGKSTLCQAITSLTRVGLSDSRGGSVQLRNREDFRNLDRKLGSIASTDANAPRIITIDNWSGNMLGSADIESILTEPTLDVWKLYAGPVNVPNWFTWFCTGNYLDLSDDLATRAVEIKLRKPKYDASWNQKLAAWDLQRVVGGIGAFFARQPADLRVATRFTDWSREVIGRIGTQDLTSGILIQEILARSEEVAVGSDDADELIELLEMFVGSGTAERKVIADQDWWIVPISVFVKFLGYHNVKNANGRDWTNRGLGREMRRHGQRLGMEPYRTKHVKGWLYRSSEGEN